MSPRQVVDLSDSALETRAREQGEDVEAPPAGEQQTLDTQQGDPTPVAPDDAASQQQAATDDGGEAGGEAPADTAAQQQPLIFGKYRTIEEAERGHKEAERAMFDARKRANDAERELAAYFAQQEQATQQGGQNPLGEQMQYLRATREIEQLAENYPDRAAYAAIVQLGDEELYDRVIEAWTEVQPMEASRFDRKMQRQLGALAVRQASEEQAQQWQKSSEEKDASLAAINYATQSLVTRFPDAGQYDAQMTQITKMFPQLLADPSQEGLERGFEAAYRLATGQPLTFDQQQQLTGAGVDDGSQNGGVAPGAQSMQAGNAAPPEPTAEGRAAAQAAGQEMRRAAHAETGGQAQTEDDIAAPDGDDYADEAAAVRRGILNSNHKELPFWVKDAREAAMNRS